MACKDYEDKITENKIFVKGGLYGGDNEEITKDSS